MASRLQDVILRGLAAAKPLATAVAPGTLYYSSDTSVTERSNGTVWESFSDVGIGVGELSLTRTFTDAEIRGWFATPIILVAAPGVGKIVLPLKLFYSTNLTTGYTNGTNSINLYWTAAGTTVTTVSVGGVMTNTTKQFVMTLPLSITVNLTIAENQPLVISNTSVAYTGGNAANTIKLTLIIV